MLNGLGGVLSTDPLKFSPSNYQSSWFDEYARTLNSKDLSTSLDGNQVATTYTIAVQSPLDNNYKTKPMESSRSLLQSAALAGGGEYALGQDGQSVLKAVLSALRKMQPVNSVFAAVTLPVSVNVRGTFLNQVYMGQFRPDANARPRWPGNLKQYQIGLAGNGNPVLDGSLQRSRRGHHQRLPAAGHHQLLDQELELLGFHHHAGQRCARRLGGGKGRGGTADAHRPGHVHPAGEPQALHVQWAMRHAPFVRGFQRCQQRRQRTHHCQSGRGRCCGTEPR